MRLPFLQTPSDLAVFDTTLDEAAELLRTEPAGAAELAVAGLQHRLDPERGMLFDYGDVVNAALRQGGGATVPELAQRLLMRFAAGDPDGWHTPITWSVAARPLPGRRAPLRFAVPDPAADGVEYLVRDGLDPAATGYRADGYQIVARITGAPHRVQDPRIGAEFDTVLAALTDGDVVYQAIGERLRGDPARAWRLGVADCVVAGAVLAERLNALGYEARLRRGYFLGPIGNDHAWCEVWEEGAWRPLDPVFAHLATAYRSRHHDAFREACRGGRLNRLLPCAVPENAPLILTPDGTPAPPWAFGGIASRATEPARVTENA
ncbi:transglutaminase [Actinomadura sp. KC06]|uniref:transglutaminase domain-containing protein n=1 Tax=Actinomadura sp. KC06 TaxID=2530369 RepID=UPI00104FBCC7|nr:transglutaminase domain-containing protein [Actinomadura sp. KC06]TDD34960.1 transglutaminase [Actinomadura sp. KC06]